MKLEEIYNHCKVLAFEGRDYSFIEQQISTMDFSEEEKIQIMVKADEYLARYQFAILEKNKALQQMIMGLVLFLLGIGLSAYTYWVSFKQYYLFYGLILVGAWFFKEGYKAYQIPLEDIVNPLDKVSQRLR